MATGGLISCVPNWSISVPLKIGVAWKDSVCTPNNEGLKIGGADTYAEYW